MIAPTATSYESFIFFYFVVFAFGFSTSAYPLLTCLWSYYSKSEGKVTAVIFAGFGISNFIFVLLITFLVNPDNKEANLIVKILYKTIN